MHRLSNGAFQLSKSRGANGYVLPLGDGCAVVDPGMKSGARAVFVELAAAGMAGSLRTCWESAHFAVPGCQGRRPGVGSRRLVMSPIMAHLTIASAWAGSRS